MDPITLAVAGVAAGVVGVVMGAYLVFVGIANLFKGNPEPTNYTLRQIQEHNDAVSNPREQHQAKLAVARLKVEELTGSLRQVEAERLTSQQREQAAKAALQRGIQPVQCPTEEQRQIAMRQIKYDPEKFHFAVCGVAGSGKSSLVNAFRGLPNKHSDAAKVGVTETTSEIGRFPDTRQDALFSRFVWYDIPGAGTLSVPSWQYFNQQGLFVFDFIIVVYDVRFTSIDEGIIENCNRFKIPVFIVRSKADQHIANMARDESDVEPGDSGYGEIFQERKRQFLLQTRSDFDKQIEKMKDASEKRELEPTRSDSNDGKQFESSYRDWLSKQIVHIVSNKQLRTLVLGNLLKQKKPINDTNTTDELSLMTGLLSAAALRRYNASGPNADKRLFKELATLTSAIIG